jgi:hypothetical protein
MKIGNEGDYVMTLSKSDLITALEIARLTIDYELINPCSTPIYNNLNLSDEEMGRLYNLLAKELS